MKTSANDTKFLVCCYYMAALQGCGEQGASERRERGAIAITVTLTLTVAVTEKRMRAR